MICGFFVATTSMYFLSAFKIYGLNVGGHDDEFLSFIGFVANFFNGPVRLVWALGVDFFGFKVTVSILFILQIILMIFVDYIATYRALYMIWVIIIMMC